MPSVDHTRRTASRPRSGRSVGEAVQRAWPATGGLGALRDSRDVLALQSLAGNQATVALLQRARNAPDGTPIAETVTAAAAAKSIHEWFRANDPGGNAVNYCTGLASNGDIFISKVNGVTAATAYLNGLQAHITGLQLERGRDIFLAQTFNTAVGSNHAEMCIMAAARARGHSLSTIYCSGPHCAFCSAVMTKAGITLGAKQGDDSQQGWAHPFAPISFGLQSGSAAKQLSVLKELDLDPTEGAAKSAGAPWYSSKPAGRSTAWL